MHCIHFARSYSACWTRKNQAFAFREFPSFIALIVLCSTLLCDVARAQPEPEVRPLLVGFGVSQITPERPTPMAGYYGTRYSTSTHDPLWAKATLLDDGTTQVVLIVVDLISTTPWMVDETRRLIEEKLAIPPDCVMLSATHSHTGPALASPGKATPWKFGEDSDEAKQYMLALPDRILQAVVLAHEARHPCTVRHGIGTETQLAFNRRFFMNDGSVGWNPGKLNPHIVREAGPTDDGLPIVALLDTKNRIEGLLCSYAIHLDTVSGTEWSADMPYTLQENSKRALGEATHVQYATGCCGDVNHIDVRSSAPQGGHGEAARIGTRLSGAVLRQLNQLRPVANTRLLASSEKVKLRVAPSSDERSQWSREVIQRVQGKNPPSFMEMVEAFRIAEVDSHEDGVIEAEVQVITLGREVAWVALPGEVFVQLGIAIKDGSPFATTSLHELANGSIGYVPTRQAYAQGNYEVVSARCAEGSGEQLVDSALHQLIQHFRAKR